MSEHLLDLDLNKMSQPNLILEDSESVLNHFAVSIKVPTYLKGSTKKLTMSARTPIRLYVQECARFYQCLELMERVLESTIREIVSLRRRHSTIRRLEGIAPQTEGLARLVHFNLGQCQDYITDALSAAKQLDQLIIDDGIEEIQDDRSIGS